MTREKAINNLKKVLGFSPTYDKAFYTLFPNGTELSLTSNVDEVAKALYPSENQSFISAFGKFEFDKHKPERDAFKAGAEWMAGQGVILNLSIDELSCGAYNACVEQGLTSEDDVIVQIRKKEKNHD